MSDDISAKILGILSCELGIKPELIQSHLLLREDLGMDSILALNVIFAAEHELGVRLREDQMVGLRTVADLQELARKLA